MSLLVSEWHEGKNELAKGTICLDRLLKLRISLYNLTNVLINWLTGGIIRCIPNRNLIIRNPDQAMCIRALII